jgi:CubicO group peptidase (beta-lactamase class C family)
MRVVTEQPGYVINESLNIDQSNWDAPAHLATGQLSMHNLFKTIALEPGEVAIDLPRSAQPLNVEQMLFDDPLMAGRKLNGEQLLNRRIFNDGLLIMRHGAVIHESYRNGMMASDRHVIHSCTKSLCAMLVAIAIEDGELDPSRDISDYVEPLQQRQEWRDVSLQHVLDMCAGIQYSEDYTDPEAHYWRYARAAGYYPPLAGEQAIGAKAWVIANLNTRIHNPGSTFAYNSCLTIVLGMALEKVYQQSLAELFERILYKHIGAESEAWFNTDPQGFPIVEGQLNLCLRDFSRWASLVVNRGKNLSGEQILPEGFVEQLVVVNPAAQQAYKAGGRDGLFPEGQYKNQFWVLDPTREQFSMIGIHGQFAWFDLRRELMMVGVGSFPSQDGELMMRALNTLWQGVSQQL